MISSETNEFDVIDNLLRKRKISPSYIPSEIRASMEVPKSLKKVIRIQQINNQNINKNYSMHINTNDSSVKQNTNSVISKHDINIDMRRSKLTWLNREFPRIMKENLIRKPIDGEMISSSIDNLKNSQNQYKTKPNRSLSQNLTSSTQERIKDSLLQRNSLKTKELLQESPNCKFKFFTNDKQELSSQEESQNEISLNCRYSFKLSDNQCFNKSIKQSQDDIIDEEDQDPPLIQQTTSVIEFNSIDQDNSYLKVKYHQNDVKLQENQNFIKFDNKFQKNQQIYSCLKPKIMNFNSVKQLDKNNTNIQNQIQTSQSQRIKLGPIEKNKTYEQNEESQMLSSQGNYSLIQNSEISQKKLQSNGKFSHLKNFRYIDYVNFMQSQNENKINESINSQQSNTSKLLIPINKVNEENNQMNLNTQVSDNCKNKNSLNNFKIQKQEIEQIKKPISRSLSSNKYTSQQKSKDQQIGKKLGLFPIPRLSFTKLEYEEQIQQENSLNSREKTNSQHQYIKKYLKVKQSQSRQSFVQNLSQIPNNYSHNVSKIQSQEDSKTQNYEQTQINKSLEDSQSIQILTQQKQIKNEEQNDNQQQSQQKNKLQNNNNCNNNNNQYLKEIKSFKLLQQILQKQSYRHQYLQPLNKSVIQELSTQKKCYNINLNSGIVEKKSFDEVNN